MKEEIKANLDICEDETEEERIERLEDEYATELKDEYQDEYLLKHDPEAYEKKKKKESILSKLLIGWFITTILLMFIFEALGYPALSLSMFGHYFAMFGLMFVSATKKQKRVQKGEYFVPGLFIFVGLSFMIGCLLYQLGILNFGG